MRIDIELQLLYKDQKKDVNIGLVASLKTFKEALLLCKSLSLLEDRIIAERLQMKLEDFVNIWAGDGYFPMAKLIDYMHICENIIPILWLALKCGYNLKPLEHELEQESRLLKEEIKKSNQELADITNIIKDDVLGGLLKRVDTLGSREGNRIAKHIEELRKELRK